MGASPWTEQNLERLKSFAGTGMSASQIGAVLGVTRNAVIGKLNRLGLAPGKPPPSIKRTDGRPVVRRKSPARIAAEAAQKIMRLQSPPAEPTPKPVDDFKIPLTQRRHSLIELTQDCCRWIVGDPATKDWFYCGGERLAGQPYCAGHCRLAFTPPQERRRAAQ